MPRVWQPQAYNNMFFNNSNSAYLSHFVIFCLVVKKIFISSYLRWSQSIFAAFSFKFSSTRQYIFFCQPSLFCTNSKTGSADIFTFKTLFPLFNAILKLEQNSYQNRSRSVKILPSYQSVSFWLLVFFIFIIYIHKKVAIINLASAWSRSCPRSRSRFVL